MSSGRAAALEGAPPAIQTMAQATGRRFSSVASAGLLRLAGEHALVTREGRSLSDGDPLVKAQLTPLRGDELNL